MSYQPPLDNEIIFDFSEENDYSAPSSEEINFNLYNSDIIIDSSPYILDIGGGGVLELGEVPMNEIIFDKDYQGGDYANIIFGGVDDTPPNLVFDPQDILVDIETNGSAEIELPGVHLLFQGVPFPQILPVGLVFGTYGYSQSAINGSSDIIVSILAKGQINNNIGISGKSSILIDVQQTSTARLNIRGNSNTLIPITVSCQLEMDLLPTEMYGKEVIIEIDTKTELYHDIFIESDVSIDIDVFAFIGREILGEAETDILLVSEGALYHYIYGNADNLITIDTSGALKPEAFINSSVLITLDSKGDFFKDSFGNSSVTITITTTADGEKSKAGYSNITIDIIPSGTAFWYGGYEMLMDSSVFINVKSKGELKRFFPIYGESKTHLTINGVGELSTSYTPIILHGESEYTLDLVTNGDIQATNKQVVFLIDEYEIDRGVVRFEIDMVVDIDNQKYEIRKVNTNKEFLKLYRNKKWYSELEIGSDIKEEIEITKTDLNIESFRKTTLRRYGCSEITLQINIYEGYSYIRNKKNIEDTINKEVDRALLDAYALYELEYE